MYGIKNGGRGGTFSQLLLAYSRKAKASLAWMLLEDNFYVTLRFTAFSHFLPPQGF